MQLQDHDGHGVPLDTACFISWIPDSKRMHVLDAQRRLLFKTDPYRSATPDFVEAGQLSQEEMEEFVQREFGGQIVEVPTTSTCYRLYEIHRDR